MRLPIQILSFVVGALTGLTHLPSARASNPMTVQNALAAAEKGDPEAEYLVAKHYQFGRDLPKDPARAVEYMRKAAEQRYSRAQNDLGAMYARGEGVDQDYEAAARWYRSSRWAHRQCRKIFPTAIASSVA